MATSSTALNILSGVAAAAAGLAGEKVSKTGSIPGLDLATIVPALLGNKAGGSGIAGKLASVASLAAKSGLLTSANIGKLAELAGTLITAGKAAKTTTGTAAKKSTAATIASLATAIMGGTGTGANLASIATLAAKVAKPAEDDKSLISMASELGKTLSGKFGVSFNGPATAVKALDSVLPKDTKTDLFKAILKGLV